MCRLGGNLCFTRTFKVPASFYLKALPFPGPLSAFVCMFKQNRIWLRPYDKRKRYKFILCKLYVIWDLGQ